MTAGTGNGGGDGKIPWWERPFSFNQPGPDGSIPSFIQRPVVNFNTRHTTVLRVKVPALMIYGFKFMMITLFFGGVAHMNDEGLVGIMATVGVMAFVLASVEAIAEHLLYGHERKEENVVQKIIEQNNSKA